MNRPMKKNLNKQKGSITPALIVITGAFTIVIYGALFLLGLQLDYSHRQTASEKALNIAEAGINYYAWHLAHVPNDYVSDTGIHDYRDPQGDIVGQFELNITPPEEGSTTIVIESTAWVNEYPNVKRTLEVQYGLPSFSSYSLLSNGSIWYGVGSVVNGMVHSNNGVRMDGTNNSIVSSSKEEYMCGSETGCHPPRTRPGVWGSGGDQGLWQFPVPAIDFDSISYDFAQMREDAQDNGLYLSGSGARGYHLIFQENGTVNVYKITKLNKIEGYSVPGQGIGQQGLGGCRDDEQEIENETLIGTYSIADTPIIFAEDNLWVEGTVKGMVTVAAVDFPIESSSSVIWIPDSIKYTTYDCSDILGLISQSDIYFSRDVPDYFQVDAILMSQKGKIIRHGYFDWCGDESAAVKQKLTINGSIISYFKSYWNFGEGPESGFIERELNFNSCTLINPPPYFPSSNDYQFISWKEK